MAVLKYPIGMQTFSELRSEGYAYVDKTQYIKPLIEQGKYIFLSRPRRFGKSLFVSTLKSFFEGRRDLFKGLVADAEISEWNPSPVFHFDFNPENYSLDSGLELRLDSILREYEAIYGSDLADITPAQRLASLITAAYKKSGRKVILLIDEYDKPLLGLEENKELFEKNQRILKSLYGNLKSRDEYIRFCFITGVARFSNISIFSDFNNLKDISIDDKYSDICGLTEEELICTFHQGIEALAEERGEDFDATLTVLRNYYDGYLFTKKGSRLYNPFSVLRALDSRSVDPYWFLTGTPTFLAKKIKAQRIDLRDVNGVACSKYDLMQVNLESRDPIPLMFQTGYLTIDRYDKDLDEYILRFPNKEVEIGFARNLLPLYVHGADNVSSPESIMQFRRDLFSISPESFMKRLSAALKGIPYEDQCEAVYRTVTTLICKLSGMDNLAEAHSYKGRSDLEVYTPNAIYIFEFKYNKSVEEAMDQILSRDYAGRFAMDSRRIYQIAANYVNTGSSRGLQYEIRKSPIAAMDR